MSDRPTNPMNHEDNVPAGSETAWDIWALMAMEHLGLDLQAARDLVIEKYLTEAGDPRPFYDWVISFQHSPSPKIIKLLAIMFAKADSPGFYPAGDKALKFKLEVTGSAGRRRDFEALLRDDIAGREAYHLMDAGHSQEQAEVIVREWLATEGVHVSNDTVQKARKAYQRRRKK